MMGATSAPHPSSTCCYKAVDVPAPGRWLSINATQRPFCIEPDTLTLTPSDEQAAAGEDLGWFPTSATATAPDPGSARTPSTTSKSTSGQGVDDRDNNDDVADDDDDDQDLSSLSLLLHQRCDIYHPPSPDLNITSLVYDEWRAWSHFLSNRSIFSEAAARTDMVPVYDATAEDHQLFNRLSRFFGWPTTSNGASRGAMAPRPMILITWALVTWLFGCGRHLLAHLWLLNSSSVRTGHSPSPPASL